MNYTVVWLPRAINQLATVWTNAADRNAVTTASQQIDIRLGNDPINEGESRTGNLRITFEAPLRVLFRVYETARMVEVTSVAVYGRRS